MSQIFISYRRADSKTVTGRVYDRLISALGRRNVFKDVNDIPVGADFPALLRQITSTCKVMLVIMGRSWATMTDEHGQPRLNDPQDFVRLEVESGLTTEGVTVVPVLVEGASMPRANQLPPSLQPLLSRNAIVVRDDPDFHDDMDTLIEGLRPLLARDRRPFYIAGAVAGVLVLALLSIFVLNTLNQASITSQATSTRFAQLSLQLSATASATSTESATPTATPRITRTPVPDTDGDGINDLNDACPLQPAPSTLLGCPAPTRLPQITTEPSTTPSAEASATPSTTPSPQGQVLVRISTLGTWLYDAPDGNTIGSISSTTALVVGITADSIWYAIEQDEGIAWLRASSQARIEGNLDDLPRLARPTLSPSDTPSPSNTPSTTPSATPSPTRTPIPDSDSDGINDVADACPFDPAPGSLLGCPPPSATPTPEMTATPLPVLARTSFSMLSPFSTVNFSDGLFSSSGRYYGDVSGVYDAITGTALYALETADFLGFNPDESLVLVDSRANAEQAESGKISLLDSRTGNVLGEIDGSLSVSFSPDGRHLLTSNASGTAMLLYSTSDYSLLSSFTSTQAVFSPDSRYLAYSNAEKTTIALYDLTRSAVVFTLPGNIASFSPNGQYLILGSQVQTSTSFYALVDLRITGWTPRFSLRGYQVSFSPDGTWLALENSAQNQTLVYTLSALYNGNTSVIFRLEGLEPAFSYDGRLAVTHNLNTGRVRSYLHRLDPYTQLSIANIRRLSFVPRTNDYLVAEVESANLSELRQILSYDFGNARTSLVANFYSSSFAISPDGTTLAADGFLWRVGEQTCQVRLSAEADLRLEPQISAEAHQRIDGGTLMYANGYLFSEERVWWRVLWEGGVLWLDGQVAEPANAQCDTLPLTTP
jgi:hypothetical protein